MFHMRIAIAAFGLCFAASALAQGASPLNPAPAVKPPAPAAPAPEKPVMPAPEAAAEVIDINSASWRELDALPGVGEARARKIVRKRPYKGKDELWQRKILPRPVYDAIKDRIVAKQR